MQTRCSILIFWMAIIVLWLPACSTQAPAPTPTPEPVVSNVTTYPRAKLIIGSSELLGAVELRNPIFRNVGQLTQAQVELENFSNLTLDLEYRIDWRDWDGFKAGAVNSWQFISLTANGSEDLTSTGKVPEATAITVTVRLPDALFESTPEEAEPEEQR
ncbi:DUF1425 domain-containing protein [Pseudomonadota bacterium]